MGRSSIVRSNYFQIIRIVICVFIFFSGVLSSYLLSNQYVPTPLSELSKRCWGTVFLQIIKQNLWIGALLSIGGFITGGISVIAILFWNGFILGRWLNVPREYFLETLKYFIYHGTFEITAFCLLGAIGFRGGILWFQLLRNGQLRPNLIPRTKEFIAPLFLLFIAAFIETYLII